MKNEPWLAAVQQAASHSLQQGAEPILVTVRAQGVKKCTLQLARGIYWVFCLSQCQCIPAQTLECLFSYVTKEVHYKVYKCHLCPITMLPALWAVAAESYLLLAYLFRQYFQHWLYVSVDLSVAFFIWSHSAFSLLEQQLHRKALCSTAAKSNCKSSNEFTVKGFLGVELRNDIHVCTISACPFATRHIIF